jgi:hypothetical protein
VLARTSYTCWTLFNVIVTNYPINATAWTCSGKAGFFWAGCFPLCFLWKYFRLLETKGRLPSEIDTLFQSGVSVSGFRSSNAESFD